MFKTYFFSVFVEKLKFQEGSTTSIACNLPHHDSEAFIWYINKEKQDENGKVLTIRNVTRKLNGTLVTCQLTNNDKEIITRTILVLCKYVEV